MNERVLRQLMCRELSTTPAADYCMRVQREVQPYMRRIVVEWMADVSLCAARTRHRMRAGVQRCACGYRSATAGCQLLGSIPVYRANLPDTAAGARHIVHVVGEQDQDAKAVRRVQAVSVHRRCRRNGPTHGCHPVTLRLFDTLQSWELLLLGRLNWDAASVTCVDFIEPFLARMRLPLDTANEVRVACRQVIYMMVKGVCVGLGLVFFTRQSLRGQHS